MTRITTACPRCGRVDLDIEEITLVQSPHEQDAWYLFDCWGCAEQVVKPAPSSIALALGSVHARTWTVPAEALERPAAESAPPIDVDDLLDVLLALSCDVPIEPPAASGPMLGSDAAGAATPSPGAAGSRPARPNAA